MFEPRWTPHGLVRRLLHEPGVRRVDISVLLDAAGPGPLEEGLIELAPPAATV